MPISLARIVQEYQTSLSAVSLVEGHSYIANISHRKNGPMRGTITNITQNFESPDRSSILQKGTPNKKAQNRIGTMDRAITSSI